MEHFTLSDFLRFLGALFLSVGGASVVIVAVARWFGDFMSQRLLARYNHRHESELEGLKGKYQKELEETKTDLEKTKSLFLRYTEKQFELYNDLWKILLYTKNQADSLWSKATPEKIPAFSEQIKLTKDAVNDNMLLIEEEHFNKLDKLIQQFENFEFGKIKLIDLRDNDIEEIKRKGITESDAQHTVEQNKGIKENYDNLILEIGKSFRDQIKG